MLDLNETVSSLVPLLSRLIGERIEIETALGAERSCVRADPTQVEQVLMNLVVNARDAMPAGGTLTIETTDAELDEKDAPPEVEPGPYTVVVVRDTGQGIDPDARSHLFEPFFTTRGEGKGTGLGLATVYGIVKQSGGFVAVESELGQGAEFRVYLPSTEEPSRAEPPTRVEGAPGGGETILVTEDDGAVRDLLVRTLDGYGYSVLEARDGREAMHLCREHDGPIDLLVLDVVLPRMEGPTLPARIHTLRPGTRVLFVSGYSGEAFDTEDALPEGLFLHKPFSGVELARKVREALDSDHSQFLISSPVEISAARAPSRFDLPR